VREGGAFRDIGIKTARGGNNDFISWVRLELQRETSAYLRYLKDMR